MVTELCSTAVGVRSHYLIQSKAIALHFNITQNNNNSWTLSVLVQAGNIIVSFEENRFSGH